MYKRRKKQASVSGAYGLGLASIGIGLMEIAAPRYVEEMLGLPDRKMHRGILQVLGLREILHGVGILTAKRGNGQLSTGVWSRVAGDVLDSALLGVASTKTERPGSFAAVATAVAGIGAADLYYAIKSTGHELAHA
jgi:hypothetical protein